MGSRPNLTPTVETKIAQRRKNVQRVEAAAPVVRPAPVVFENTTFPAAIGSISITSRGEVVLQLIIPKDWARLALEMNDARGKPIVVDVKPYGT